MRVDKLGGRNLPFFYEEIMVAGPTAPQSNPPITPQYHSPSLFSISAITLGATTTVTMTASSIGGTTVNPNYVVGQLVRFIIPPLYGTRQLNQQTGYVISLPSSTQVEVDIDSALYDAFVSSPTGSASVAQISAIGDINSGPINSSGPSSAQTYIDGSFRDISPV